MTQKERMLAGLPYKAWMDGLPEERARAQRACWVLLFKKNEKFFQKE